MATTKLEHLQSLMKQDNKHCTSRGLMRETTIANSFKEDYYEGTSAAVPFTWESQPGTPKVKFGEAPLPPLTPPPSYYNTATKRTLKHSKLAFLHSMFPKLNTRKLASSDSSFSSSTSSYSLAPWSVRSSPMTPSKFLNERRGGRVSSPRLSRDSRAGENKQVHESPVSNLCFGISRQKNNATSKW